MKRWAPASSEIRLRPTSLQVEALLSSPRCILHQVHIVQQVCPMCRQDRLVHYPLHELVQVGSRGLRSTSLGGAHVLCHLRDCVLQKLSNLQLGSYPLLQLLLRLQACKCSMSNTDTDTYMPLGGTKELVFRRGIGLPFYNNCIHPLSHGQQAAAGTVDARCHNCLGVTSFQHNASVRSTSSCPVLMESVALHTASNQQKLEEKQLLMPHFLR